MQGSNKMQQETMTYGTAAFSLNFQFQDDLTGMIFSESDSRRALTDSDTLNMNEFDKYGFASFMFLYVLIS